MSQLWYDNFNFEFLAKPKTRLSYCDFSLCCKIAISTFSEISISENVENVRSIKIKTAEQFKEILARYYQRDEKTKAEYERFIIEKSKDNVKNLDEIFDFDFKTHTRLSKGELRNE